MELLKKDDFKESNSQMKKILFLDIDGVLNSKWWYTQISSPGRFS